MEWQFGNDSIYTHGFRLLIQHFLLSASIQVVHFHVEPETNDQEIEIKTTCNTW